MRFRIRKPLATSSSLPFPAPHRAPGMCRRDARSTRAARSLVRACRVEVPPLPHPGGSFARLPHRPVRGADERALELRDVVVDYASRGGGRVGAVAGASIAVEAGQIVGLVGADRAAASRPSPVRRSRLDEADVSGSVVFDEKRGSRPSAAADARGATSPGFSSSFRTPTRRSTRVGRSAPSSPTRS